MEIYVDPELMGAQTNRSNINPTEGYSRRILSLFYMFHNRNLKK